MDNNLPLNHQNIDDIKELEENTKEYFMEKWGIMENDSGYIGEKSNLRNFFIDIEKHNL